MKRSLRLGVLISGRGSNLQSLIDACAQSDFPAEIALVISNTSDAGGLQRAEAANIPCSIIDHKLFAGREAFEKSMTKALETAGVDLICLAGFMRILTNDFVHHWQDRMINIHPSLLPAYKGLNTHARALEDGVRFSGCTVHFVRTDMDVGPIILQAAVPVMTDDTVETLASRVLEYEHSLYPQAVKWFAEGKLHLRGDKVEIDCPQFSLRPIINPPI